MDLRFLSLLLLGTYLLVFFLISEAESVDKSIENLDKYDVTKIYPTKDNGREWYFNEADPWKDHVFYSDADLKKQSTHTWRASGEEKSGDSRGQVRLNIGTLEGEEEWKNVEITGYAKVIRTTGHDKYRASDIENIFQWYARGGYHNNDYPCSGTSIKGRIHLNGEVGWVKELWHNGGYTTEIGINKMTPSLVENVDDKGRYYDGRWFGFKVIIFNVNEDKEVKMEMYLDEKANNQWKKISSLTDNGNWTSNSERFHDVDCGRERNHIINNSGPVVAFRSDYIVWNFKNLSVREIHVD